MQNAVLKAMGDSSKDDKVITTQASRQSSEAQEGLTGITATADVKQKSVRGGAATLIGQGVTMAMQIGTTLILARLLSPADYGLQAMVLTLVNLFSLFKDAGLSAATVQRESLTHEQISTLFWINVALGAVLTVAVAAAGPILAAFYKEPRLLWVTVASATVFLSSSFTFQHNALLNRAMRFTTSVKIDILSCTIGAAIAIGMAALGCGYWSLICQNISLPIVGAVAVWIAMPWIPGRPRWTPEIHSMVRFGGTVSVNSFVVYIAYNMEKVLLGRFWGAAPLGLYTRAYQLASLPMQQFNNAVGGVVFPALSRLQSDPQRLRRSYLKSHSLVVSLTVPIVVGCTLFADEIVRIMLGPKWIGAALILRLLSPTILVFALMNPLSWLLRATGRVARSLKIALFIAPVVILGILAGIRQGPPGVAMGYSAAMVLLFGPLVAWAKHDTGITTSDYLDCIKRPLTAGALGAAGAWLFKLAFHNSISPIPLFLVGLTIFFAVYAGLLLFVMGQRAVYADLLSSLFQQKQGLPEKSQA